MTFPTIFAGTWSITAVVVLLYVVQAQRTLRHLRVHHPSKWRELGELSLFLNNSMRNSSLFVGFLLRKRYLELNDIQLSRECRTLTILFWITMSLFFILLLLMLSQVGHPYTVPASQHVGA